MIVHSMSRVIPVNDWIVKYTGPVLELAKAFSSSPIRGLIDSSIRSITGVLYNIYYNIFGIQHLWD